MAQLLTICRIGADWAARDVTGAIYGRSPDIREAMDSAERLSKRMGGQIALSEEAKAFLRQRPPGIRG